jgi:hypothetical protein
MLLRSRSMGRIVRVLALALALMGVLGLGIGGAGTTLSLRCKPAHKQPMVGPNENCSDEG